MRSRVKVLGKDNGVHNIETVDHDVEDFPRFVAHGSKYALLGS